MEELKNLKIILKGKKDFDQINNLLLKVSELPTQDIITIVNFLFKELNPTELSKIKLNLVFLIGEISKNLTLELTYVDYLIKSYYESDRWIRNEIVKALFNIVDSNPNSIQKIQSILTIIETGLKEDYEPIQENSLRLLTLNIPIPVNFAKTLISILDSRKPQFNDSVLNVLRKILINAQELFKFLDKNQIYKTLDKEKVRMLLIEYSTSVNELDVINKIIKQTTWDDNIKDIFFREISTLERIYLKKVENEY